MNENIENNEWMSEAPRLAAMGKSNPFTVPERYFAVAEEAVVSSIFFDDLKQKVTSNSFEVPVNYFEELTQRIETAITLSTISKAENVFAVPDSYFDTLQSRISAKIAASEPKRTTKIVSLWKTNMFKYASAACFLLISSFGVYLYQNSETTEAKVQSADVATEQMLYDIDESTIVEHIESQNSSTKKTTSASDTEMENYILANYSTSDLAQDL